MKSFMQVCFFDRGAETVNVQGSDKECYLSSLTKYTGMSSLIIIKVCRDFKKGLHSSLVKLMY